MSTSNYIRIRQLGKIAAERLIQEDYHRTFSTAEHFWKLIEETLAASRATVNREQTRYDILSGWGCPTGQITVPTVGDAVVKLRDCLMQWTAHFRVHQLEFGSAMVLSYLAEDDAKMLEEKGRHYGDSWKKRGGVGAFMMLARKWDRLETIHARESKYDTRGEVPILRPEGGITMTDFLERNPGNVIDDVNDLRGYLLLVEDEVIRRQDDGADPTTGYVNQG